MRFFASGYGNVSFFRRVGAVVFVYYGNDPKGQGAFYVLVFHLFFPFVFFHCLYKFLFYVYYFLVFLRDDYYSAHLFRVE